MYTVLIISPEGAVSETTQAKAPDLKQLQAAVKGLIETVPHLTKYYKEDGSVLKRGVAYVNEEGMLHSMPMNRKATAQWLLNLGDGPFRYQPVLHGPMIYYAKMPRIKDAPPIA